MIEEWIEVDKELPTGSGVYFVKKSNLQCILAYYHKDKMIYMTWYWPRSHQLSHWQCKETMKWLYDVTHWKRK